MSDPEQEKLYLIGQCVEKVGGDYRFPGVVVARFRKRGGLIRYVVENDDGVLFIFSGKSLQDRPA